LPTISKFPLYYYRDKDKNEIDLITEDGWILHPIEIKTSNDRTKTFGKREISAKGKYLDFTGTNNINKSGPNAHYLSAG